MRSTHLWFLLVLSSLTAITSCQKDYSVSTDEQELKAAQSSGAGEGALPHTKQYGAEVATTWYHLLTDITRTSLGLPPQTIRLFAYSGMALYESVVPGMPSYQSMYTRFTGNVIPYEKKKDYYWPAAANAAMARIASRLLQNYSATPNLAPVQQLEVSFHSRFAAEASAEQLQRSVDFGKLVADHIYEWSFTDGTFTPSGAMAPCPPYVPLGGPGNWVPTPPGLFPAAGACQGLLRTFIPGIVASARPVRPPAYSTDPASGFYKMMYDVYLAKTTATVEDKLVGEAWRDRPGNYNTPAHVVKLTTQIIAKEGLNLEEASALYARQGIAVFDAIATAVGAKFYYSLMRPVTYIRNQIDPVFETQYPTPQHPSYPAVAPPAAAAGIVMLEHAFGPSYSFVDTTQKALYGTFSYSSFEGLLSDVERSRTHTGLNFKLAVDRGTELGRKVGEIVYALPFKKQ